MQVLQAGRHKLLLLELDTEFVENIARQAGFEFRLADQERCMVLDLNAEGRQAPLLLLRRRGSCKPRAGSRAASSTSTASPARCCKPRSRSQIKDRNGRAAPQRRSYPDQ